MARMHSRRRGKAGSTKPTDVQMPSWVRYKDKEAEMLVVKLAKEGLTGSQIGLHLRDTYGIPDIKLVTGKTITQILEEKKLKKELPEDLQALIKKAVQVRKHLESNHTDMTAKRGLQLTESKIKRLSKYYKKEGMLDPNWKFNPEKAAMFVE